MYSCVSLLLLAGNLSREHMIRITIVGHVGKVHFRPEYDILGHDTASFPKIGFIWVGYVIVKDFCQVSILTLIMPAKKSSENSVCIYGLLQIFANTI